MRPNWAAAAVGLFLVLAVLSYSFFTYGSSGIGQYAPLSIVGLFVLGIALLIYKNRKGRALEIKLDKQVYLIGEALTGRIIFNLEKEKQARALKVRFYGREPSTNDRSPSQYCDVEVPLAEARTFRKGDSFRFSIPMPAEVQNYYREGTPFNTGPCWFVEAQLELPGEMDMENKIIVNLKSNPKAQSAPTVQTKM